MQRDVMGCSGLLWDGMRWGGMRWDALGCSGVGRGAGPYPGSQGRCLGALTGFRLRLWGRNVALRTPAAPGGSRRAHTAALRAGSGPAAPMGARRVPAGLQPLGDVGGGCAIAQGHTDVVASSSRADTRTQ